MRAHGKYNYRLVLYRHRLRPSCPSLHHFMNGAVKNLTFSLHCRIRRNENSTWKIIKLKQFCEQQLPVMNDGQFVDHWCQNDVLMYRLSVQTLTLHEHGQTDRHTQSMFWWLMPGTVYLPRLKPPTHCCSSGERQKRTSSTSFWTNLRTKLRTLETVGPFKMALKTSSLHPVTVPNC